MTGSSRSTPYNGIYDRVCTELSRKNRMAALAHIFGKLKGKPPQQVDFNNVSRDLASRSDDELR